VRNCAAIPSLLDLHNLTMTAIKAAIFRDDILPFPSVDRVKAFTLLSFLEHS
jgi:hypothetical protein